MPIQRKLKILALSVALGLTSMPSAQATSVTWDFTYAAVASPNGPFTSVASLTLEDSTCGGFSCVLFTLDPNESNDVYKDPTANNPSKIKSLNIAFKTNVSDDTLGSTPATPQKPQGWHLLTSISGESVDSWLWSMNSDDSRDKNDDKLDASYRTGEGQFGIDWDNDFGVSEISMWSILRTTIADNFSIMASPTGTSTKPSSTFGILSISSFKRADGTPTSNWATAPAPSAVPVPASVWLFGTALLGFIGISRRTKV
jgi:hypothetical protein